MKFRSDRTLKGGMGNLEAIFLAIIFLRARSRPLLRNVKTTVTKL